MPPAASRAHPALLQHGKVRISRREAGAEQLSSAPFVVAAAPPASAGSPIAPSLAPRHLPVPPSPALSAQDKHFLGAGSAHT